MSQWYGYILRTDPFHESIGKLKVSTIARKCLCKATALRPLTPRAVKRYINIYRLLRVRVPKDHLAQFLGTSGNPREYEAVMLLLGLYNVDPILGRWFGLTLVAGGTKDLRAAIGQLGQSHQMSASQQKLVDLLIQYCNRFQNSGDQPLTEAFLKWHPIVSRFSFCRELIC